MGGFPWLLHEPHRYRPGAPSIPRDAPPCLWCSPGTEQLAGHQGDGLKQSHAGSKGTCRAGKEPSTGKRDNYCMCGAPARPPPTPEPVLLFITSSATQNRGGRKRRQRVVTLPRGTTQHRLPANITLLCNSNDRVFAVSTVQRKRGKMPGYSEALFLGVAQY